MTKLQEIYNRIQENKKAQKEINASLKQAYANSAEYQQVNDELKGIRQRKKEVEMLIKDDFSSELNKLEDIKLDIKTDFEVMADVALNQYLKGEAVLVTDEFEQEYEPIFKVNFKKVQ